MATLRPMVGKGTTVGRGGMTTAELIQETTTIGEGVGEAQAQGNKFFFVTFPIFLCAGMTTAERGIVLMTQGIGTTDGD